MLGLYVRDLPSMVAFYRDVVGLQTDWEAGDDYAEFFHDGIRFCLFHREELIDLLDVLPKFPAGTPNGSFQLSINFPLGEDVKREYNRMILAGAQPIYSCKEMPWKMYSAVLTDLEGNLIELTSWNDSEPGTSNGSH